MGIPSFLDPPPTATPPWTVPEPPDEVVRAVLGDGRHVGIEGQSFDPTELGHPLPVWVAIAAG